MHCLSAVEQAGAACVLQGGRRRADRDRPTVGRIDVDPSLVGDAVAKLRAAAERAFGFAIIDLRNSPIYAAALSTFAGRNAGSSGLLATGAFAGNCKTVAC
jgi:hypothetical protein